MRPQPSPPTRPVTPTGCCPVFDPAAWDDREITWKDKPFLADHVTSLLHVPLNMGRRIRKDIALIEASHAEGEAGLMLSDEHSSWGADLFIEVSKDIPGAKMVRLSGTFLTKVFAGPFSEAGAWAHEMTTFVAARGRTLEKLYFWYTTCPRCAKAYGNNFVVMFAKVAPGRRRRASSTGTAAASIGDMEKPAATEPKSAEPPVHAGDRRCAQCGERLPAVQRGRRLPPLLCIDCALVNLPHTD